MNEQISRRKFIRDASIGISALALSSSFNCFQKQKKPPNFIIIFTDDQGYNDVGVFDARGFETPYLDAMADEGKVFTDFHVAAPVCTPSRASLLTGCYPQRVGLPDVLAPPGPEWTKGKTTIGLNDKEVTIAEILKNKGYATSCIGKWHLGHQEKFLPTKHGFDEYFGLPYSNDMRPENDPLYPPLPLMQGTEVIEENPDQSTLTYRYTKQAVDFITKNKNKPFFLYLAHSMPHVPIFCTDKFKGKSKLGLYGDVIMEIDWSVGEILKAVKNNQLEENTLIIFTSDNGPWTVYGNHAGSAYPLRGCKMTTFEGGQRVPCIMKWKNKIPVSTVCNQFATTMDFLPTIANIVNAELPDKKIDGHNIERLLFHQHSSKTPYEVFYYYNGNELTALRSGKWKLHLPHEYLGVKRAGKDGKMGEYFYDEIELSLFDLENDIGESKNVADQNPQIVKKLLKYAEEARKDLGDKNIIGTGIRECGRV